MFLWRCFGDGIAAVFQDKYALKHLYYDSNYLPKQSAGSLTGKTGFKLEYRTLRHAIRSNVPALLSDLTNIIRHGDLCLLAGPAPFLMELKSSRALSKRAKRQLEELKVLDEFFKNDGADNFRGVPNTRRRELKSKEVNYESQLNECMGRALLEGLAITHPEPGLIYVAANLKAGSVNYSNAKLVDSHLTPSTLVVSLSPDESWLPLYPFTLSMTPANALLFMQRCT